MHQLHEDWLIHHNSSAHVKSPKVVLKENQFTKQILSSKTLWVRFLWSMLMKTFLPWPTSMRIWLKWFMKCCPTSLNSTSRLTLIHNWIVNKIKFEKVYILSSSGPDPVQVNSKCLQCHIKLNLFLRIRRSGPGADSIIASYHHPPTQETFTFT